VITLDPVPTSVVSGVNGSLTAKVRSTLGFTYKWSKDGTDIATGSLYSMATGSLAGSTTETTLTLGLLSPTTLTAGTYKVTVTNDKGVASSAEAVVAFFVKPQFQSVTFERLKRTDSLTAYTTQKTGPKWVSLVPLNEKLRVVVTGTPTFLWTYTPFSGTSPTWSSTNDYIDFNDASVPKGDKNAGGWYYCKATAGTYSWEVMFTIQTFAAAAASEAAISGAPLEIVSEPLSVSTSVGGAVVLGVEVTSGERSYAWFKTGADGKSVLVSTVGSGLLYLNPVKASDAGAYFVVVTDPLGNSVTSRPANVTVLPAND
jgi:hypothetical protein